VPLQPIPYRKTPMRTAFTALVATVAYASLIWQPSPADEPGVAWMLAACVVGMRGWRRRGAGQRP